MIAPFLFVSFLSFCNYYTIKKFFCQAFCEKRFSTFCAKIQTKICAKCTNAFCGAPLPSPRRREPRAKESIIECVWCRTPGGKIQEKLYICGKMILRGLFSLTQPLKSHRGTPVIPTLHPSPLSKNFKIFFIFDIIPNLISK